MRTLYICSKDLWFASHHKGLFHPVGGSHYLDLENDLVLVAAVMRDEGAEIEFNDNPDVSPLPDPIFEGNVKLSDHGKKPEKHYHSEHHTALKNALGVSDNDTVLDVSKKSQARIATVRISAIY